MRKRVSGRRRLFALATLTLACTFVVSAMGIGVGAADARDLARVQTHTARLAARVHASGRHARRKVPKHHKRLTTAQKKQRMVSYLKVHPSVLAAHRARTGVAHRPIRTAGRAKAKVRIKARRHRTRRATSGARQKAKKKTGSSKARPKKSKKKLKQSSGLRRYAVLFGGAAFGGVALFLIYSSFRKPSRFPAGSRKHPRTTLGSRAES